mgnify:CR=1 FL=1
MAFEVNSLPLSLVPDLIRDHPRPAAIGNESVQLADNPHPRERRVDHQRQALALAVVDDRQDAEATAVGELVRDESIPPKRAVQL